MTKRQHVELSPEELLRELGNLLRSRREASGMSQEALANACGLHRTYIGAVERGERNPTYLTLLKYSKGLGLSAPELLAARR